MMSLRLLLKRLFYWLSQIKRHRNGEVTVSATLITEHGISPCPFCGARAQLKRWVMTPEGSAASDSSYGVQCVGCTAKIYMLDTPESALSKWNSRSTPGGEHG